jgi:hypothetical protein
MWNGGPFLLDLGTENGATLRGQRERHEGECHRSPLTLSSVTIGPSTRDAGAFCVKHIGSICTSDTSQDED